MDMKKRNIIIILCIMIALAALDLLALNAFNKKQETAQERQIIYISNYSIGSVQKIEIENQYGKLVLVLEDDIWHAVGHEQEEIDQEIMTELTYMLAHIMGERVVSDTEDEENMYGMLTPSARITTCHDGVIEQTFTIGNKAPLEDEYYMQSSVFKKIYTVDVSYYVYGQLKLEDLLALNQVNVGHADIEKIKIKNSINEEYTIQRTSDDNDISLCYWEFIEPFNHDADTAVMYGTEEYEGMITYIIQLAADSVIGKMEEEELFGLDVPVFTAEIYGSGNQYQSFAIGDYGDEDNYSLSFNNDNNIYAISKDKAPFINYSAFMTADANLALINIDALDRVEISLPDVETAMDIEITSVSSSDGSVTYDVDIQMDGISDNIAGDDVYEQMLLLYQDIVTIKIDGLTIYPGEPGEKIGSIIYYLNSEIKDKYTVEFFEYSLTHYIAKKNGEDAGYLVSRNSIEKLALQYQHLLAGELS